MSSLGQVIAKTRIGKRLTQVEAASFVGVSETAWQNWESGSSIPRRKNRVKIEEVLELKDGTLDELAESESTKDQDLCSHLFALNSIKLSLRSHPSFEDILDKLHDVECILLGIDPLSSESGTRDV